MQVCLSVVIAYIVDAFTSGVQSSEDKEDFNKNKLHSKYKCRFRNVNWSTFFFHLHIMYYSYGPEKILCWIIGREDKHIKEYDSKYR